jgi:nucleoid DNA-binding protein
MGCMFRDRRGTNAKSGERVAIPTNETSSHVGAFFFLSHFGAFQCETTESEIGMSPSSEEEMGEPVVRSEPFGPRTSSFLLPSSLQSGPQDNFNPMSVVLA